MRFMIFCKPEEKVKKGRIKKWDVVEQNVLDSLYGILITFSVVICWLLGCCYYYDLQH